jgi:hypothetical protein
MMSPWKTFAHGIPAKMVKLARLMGKCVVYLCIKSYRREPEIGLVADSLSYQINNVRSIFFLLRKGLQFPVVISICTLLGTAHLSLLESIMNQSHMASELAAIWFCHSSVLEVITAKLRIRSHRMST